jgi:hypothetical protein
VRQGLANSDLEKFIEDEKADLALLKAHCK